MNGIMRIIPDIRFIKPYMGGDTSLLLTKKNLSWSANTLKQIQNGIRGW
jgi:hypothetical protein